MNSTQLFRFIIATADTGFICFSELRRTTLYQNIGTFLLNIYERTYLIFRYRLVRIYDTGTAVLVHVRGPSSGQGKTKPVPYVYVRTLTKAKSEQTPLFSEKNEDAVRTN